MKNNKDKSWEEVTGKKNPAFDASWNVPDTTAFKSVKPSDVPESTYNYQGDSVGTKNGLPDSNYNYKGENTGKSSNLPTSNYNYTGDSSAGKGSPNKG